VRFARIIRSYMSGTCFLWVPAAYREPLHPFKALPLQELCFPQPRPALPGHLRSYRLMRQTFTSSALRSRSKRKSLQVAVSPCWIQALPDVVSPRIFLYVLGPLPRWLLWCSYPFLPTRHRPSWYRDPVGAIQIPVLQLLYGIIIEAAIIL
jgi:hypothetical protein